MRVVQYTVLFYLYIQALSELIAEQKSELIDTVEAGHELEGYADAEPSSLPDIGYTDLQRRYDNLKVRKSIAV